MGTKRQSDRASQGLSEPDDVEVNALKRLAGAHEEYEAALEAENARLKADVQSIASGHACMRMYAEDRVAELAALKDQLAAANATNARWMASTGCKTPEEAQGLIANLEMGANSHGG